MLSYAAFITSEYTAWIAVLVFAYQQGQATEAGLVALAQLVPAAALAPLLSTVADRLPPVRLLVVGYGVQTVALAATGLAIHAGSPALLVYAGAVVAATSVVTTRPGQAPLTPALSRTPAELTGVNVALGWVENLGVVAAGAVTGLVLATGDVGLAVLLAASLAAVAGLLVLPLRTRPVPIRNRNGALHEAAAGARALARSPRPRLLVGLLWAEWVVIGALDVLFVVLAVDVLNRGAEWAGYLNTAFGIGGVVAGAGTAALVGRRLGGPIVASGLVLSVTLGLAAAAPGAIATAALLAIVGGGRAVFDVATRTLLQRAVSTEVVGRVFGLVEGLAMAGLAVGSLLVPAVVAVGGDQWALVTVAFVLPVTALLGGRTMLALDAEATVPVVEIALLRSLRIFADLPAPALEALARSVTRMDAPVGTVLLREGDVGERFYVIADGQVSIESGGRDLGVSGRGDGVGEIALLHAVPRTATVTVAAPTTLYVLERDAFLDAVTGHPTTSRTAASVVTERLYRSGHQVAPNEKPDPAP